MTKIVNSAAGNSIFDVNGNAIDNESYKPKLGGGAAQNLGVNQDNLDNSTFFATMATGQGSSITPHQEIAFIDVEEVFTNTKKDQQLTSVVTVLTASGIRDGKWDEYNGSWDSGYPLTSDDTAALNITNDNANNQVDRITSSDGMVPNTHVQNS